MIIAAQGTRADAGLAVGFTVSSRGLGIPVERLGHCAGMVVNSTRVFGVSTAVAALAAGFTVSSSSLGVSAESMARSAGTIESSDALASSPVAGQSALHVRCYAPFASSSVVIVSVVKRAGPGVVPVVVISYVSVMPVESPMTPAPSKTGEETDSEADSERKVWATEPNSGIRVPVKPRGDWVSVHQPRVVGRNVNDTGVRRFNDDRRALRRYDLLRRGLKIAGCLSPLAHHLYGIHNILLLVVVGVA